MPPLNWRSASLALKSIFEVEYQNVLAAFPVNLQKFAPPLSSPKYTMPLFISPTNTIVDNFLNTKVSVRPVSHFYEDITIGAHI